MSGPRSRVALPLEVDVPVQADLCHNLELASKEHPEGCSSGLAEAVVVVVRAALTVRGTAQGQLTVLEHDPRSQAGRSLAYHPYVRRSGTRTHAPSHGVACRTVAHVPAFPLFEPLARPVAEPW